MRTNTLIIGIGITLGGIQLAAASDVAVSLLGVSLGKPAPIPACTANSAAKNDHSSNSVEDAIYRRLHGDETSVLNEETPSTSKPSGPCFSKARRPGSLPSSMTPINIPIAAKARPGFVKYGYISADMMDGKIEQLTIFTTGEKSQGEVLRQLTEKFGKPDNLKEIEKQNRFGAKFTAIDARWKFGNSEVQFQSVFNDLDTGVVSASSPKALAAMEEAYQANRATEPHL